MKMDAYFYRHVSPEIQKKRMVQILSKIRQLKKALLSSNKVSPLYCLKVQRELENSLVTITKTKDLIEDLEVVPKNVDRYNLLLQFHSLEERIRRISEFLQRFRKISLESTHLQKELHSEILTNLPETIRILGKIMEETSGLEEIVDQFNYCPN